MEMGALLHTYVDFIANSCEAYVIVMWKVIMFPAVDKHLKQQIRYFFLISVDYVSLFIFLCVRDCKGLLIKLRCNTGEHVTCVQNTQDAVSQSMIKSWLNVRVVGSIAMFWWKCCTLCMVWLGKKNILKSSNKLSSSHNNSSHGGPTCRCTVAAIIKYTFGDSLILEMYMRKYLPRKRWLISCHDRYGKEKLDSVEPSK